MSFENKVVLVTGSSRGIGREIARGFSSKGCNVVINYNKSEQQARELEKEITGSGGKCLVVKANVGDFNEVEQMFEKIVEEFGTLDILVNNAGIFEDSPVWKMSPETWHNVIESDLTSIFNCTRFATALMRKQGYGRIVNISSVVGQTGSFGTSNYAAAKAGIFGFMRTVAKEVARKNITINTIALGFIEAGMLLTLPEDIREQVVKQIPMRRWGKPEEVVATVQFLASESAGYITGQVIGINGGYYM